MTSPESVPPPSADEVLAVLRQRQQVDLPTHGGRTLAYVYDSGMPRVDELGRQAVAAYAGSNGLDPTAFPSLQQMENELVGMAADLLRAPDGVVGTVTSGGTESVLLAVQAARDARPDITEPRMVLPSTAHAAFHKAAYYFGVEAVVVPVAPGFRADAAAMAAALDDQTVLVAASAPSYAHGVVDPVAEIAAEADSRGIRCHVDACIGGWILPFAAELGREVPGWDFDVPGVTSISVDLHKYGYAPKGASLLMHRSSAVRRPQLFANGDWPGYTMLNSTLQSTKSGGPLAGAWAVARAIGRDGYRRLAAEVWQAVDRVVAGVATIPQLRLVATPDSSLIALGTDDSCDPFTISDELVAAGWYVQSQFSYRGGVATIHLSLSAATLPSIDDFLAALRSAVAVSVERGPVQPDPTLAALVADLDADSLADPAVFGQLLAAAGLVDPDAGEGEGGIALPTRMAEVNALLDLATPAVREAVLIGVLDRLSTPARGFW